ncbi:hypothetical protein [Tessaracoccus oleiagri]|nr:hypothetical protein [Tessaracoccus oleiagri]
MRVLSKRGIALLGAIGLAATLSACGAEEQDTASSTASTPAATSAPAETPSQDATAENEAESETVESIDAMVAALQKKNYACKDWQQTDEVAEAQASGTCNGEDTVMVFADAAGVEAMTAQLDDEGRGYVYGENWVVADTVTPTFVRNALGGTAVKAGAAS